MAIEGVLARQKKCGKIGFMETGKARVLGFMETWKTSNFENIYPSGLRPDRRGWDRSVDREHSVHRTFCKVSDVKVSIVKLICFRSRCQRRKSDLRTITLSISFFVAKVANSDIESEPFVTLWDDFDGLDAPGT